MALTRLGMDSNWLWMTGMGNPLYASFSTWHISSIAIAGEESWIKLSTIHGQMFSIDDRSRDPAVQGNNQLVCVSRKVGTRLATCSVALYCCNIAFDSAQSQGKITGHKMTEMYQSAFKLPSVWTRHVRVVYLMAAQTITTGARFSIEKSNPSKRWGLFLNLQTLVRLSKYCM